MNSKTILILTVCIAASTAAAVATLHSRERSEQSSETSRKLFPELAKSLDQVTLIKIERKDGTVVLEKTAEGWGLADKSHYPVELEPVRKVLLSLGEMETLEAKTKSPEQYTKLGVEDVGAEGSQSTLLTLQDGAGKDLARLVVGKPRESKNPGGAGAGQMYVRKPGEAQSWLVKGQLDLREKGSDWLQKKIVEVKRDRMRAVEVKHPGGEVVDVSRERADQTDFALAGIPEGKELKYPTVAGTLASGLEYVNLEDVEPASAIDFEQEPGPTTTFRCFDGLVVVVHCKEKDGKTYARFVASYEEPAPVVGPTPEVKPGEDAPTAETKPKTKTPEEVKAEALELNARFSKWAYVISSYNRTAYFKKLDDLVKDKTPPPAPTPPGGAADGDTYKIPDNLPPEIQEQIKKDLEAKGQKAEVVPAPKPDGTPGGQGTPPPAPGGTPQPSPTPPHD